jgi:hypothetical protein
MDFMIAFVGRKDSDEPEELRPIKAPSVEAAIRSAKSAVQNMELARGRYRNLVIGFILENHNGDECFRWYDDVLCETPVLGV